jgi:hypothetical protein
MTGRVQQFGNLDRGHAVRRVLVALAALVLHDIALPVHALGCHRIEEIAHAIRFQEERQVERVRGHVDVVVRAVGLGRGVIGSSGRLEALVELAFLDVSRSLEHQMLEEVGEPRVSRLLACRADVVPDVDGHDWNRVILVQDHVQAVWQRELRVTDFQWWSRTLRLLGENLKRKD